MFIDFTIFKAHRPVTESMETLTTPLVSIITVNFNQIDLTCALLDSIRAQDYKAVQVVVVDNGSKLNPTQHIAAQYPEVLVIRSEQNLGFAGGNNLALPYVLGDFVFYINNDAEVTTGCIEKLLQVFSNPRVGVVSPLICYDTSRSTPDGDLIQYCGTTALHPLTARNVTIGAGQRDQGQFKIPQSTAYAHGAAMMVRATVLNHVGPMHDAFFLYYEELYWCIRVKAAGYEIWVEPHAKVYHKESVSVGTASPLKTYFLNRNRVWLMRRHHRGLQWVVFLLFLNVVTIPVNTVRFMLRGQWRNLRAFLQAMWWQVRYAITGRDKNPSWLPVSLVHTQPNVVEVTAGQPVYSNKL